MNKKINTIFLLTLTACGQTVPLNNLSLLTAASPSSPATSTLYCSKAVDSTPCSIPDDSNVNPGACITGETSVGYTYQIVKFQSGDSLVSCSVKSDAGEYSSSRYFKSGSGSDTYDCNLVADIDHSPSAGAWLFTSVSGVPTATYNDNGSPLDKYQYTFLAADCE